MLPAYFYPGILGALWMVAFLVVLWKRRAEPCGKCGDKAPVHLCLRCHEAPRGPARLHLAECGAEECADDCPMNKLVFERDHARNHAEGELRRIYNALSGARPDAPVGIAAPGLAKEILAKIEKLPTPGAELHALMSLAELCNVSRTRMQSGHIYKQEPRPASDLASGIEAAIRKLKANEAEHVKLRDKVAAYCLPLHCPACLAELKLVCPKGHQTASGTCLACHGDGKILNSEKGRRLACPNCQQASGFVAFNQMPTPKPAADFYNHNA